MEYIRKFLPSLELLHLMHNLLKRIHIPVYIDEDNRTTFNVWVSQQTQYYNDALALHKSKSLKTATKRTIPKVIPAVNTAEGNNFLKNTLLQATSTPVIAGINDLVKKNLFYSKSPLPPLPESNTPTSDLQQSTSLQALLVPNLINAIENDETLSAHVNDLGNKKRQYDSIPKEDSTLPESKLSRLRIQIAQSSNVILDSSLQTTSTSSSAHVNDFENKKRIYYFRPGNNSTLSESTTKSQFPESSNPTSDLQQSTFLQAVLIPNLNYALETDETSSTHANNLGKKKRLFYSKPDEDSTIPVSLLSRLFGNQEAQSSNVVLDFSLQTTSTSSDALPLPLFFMNQKTASKVQTLRQSANHTPRILNMHNNEYIELNYDDNPQSSLRHFPWWRNRCAICASFVMFLVIYENTLNNQAFSSKMKSQFGEIIKIFESFIAKQITNIVAMEEIELLLSQKGFGLKYQSYNTYGFLILGDVLDFIIDDLGCRSTQPYLFEYKITCNYECDICHSKTTHVNTRLFTDLSAQISPTQQSLSSAIELYIRTHIPKRKCVACINMRTKTLTPSINTIDMPDILQVRFDGYTPQILERDITVFNQRYHFVSGIYGSSSHFNTIVIRNSRIELAESMRQNDSYQFETIAQVISGDIVYTSYTPFKLLRAYYIKYS